MQPKNLKLIWFQPFLECLDLVDSITKDILVQVNFFFLGSPSFKRHMLLFGILTGVHSLPFSWATLELDKDAKIDKLKACTALFRALKCSFLKEKSIKYLLSCEQIEDQIFIYRSLHKSRLFVKSSHSAKKYVWRTCQCEGLHWNWRISTTSYFYMWW